jgi:hypothetical protein
MPRRRAKPFKLKLKKKTIYTIFAIVCFLMAAILVVSFSKHGTGALWLNSLLKEKFGSLGFMMPIAFIFLGFLFLHLKRLYLSRLNVFLGYILFFVSLLGLTRAGAVGQELFNIFAEIISNRIADVVFIGGLLVGLIVFFDTSIDDIIEGLAACGKTLKRLIPRSIFVARPKPLINRNKHRLKRICLHLRLFRKKSLSYCLIDL